MSINQKEAIISAFKYMAELMETAKQKFEEVRIEELEQKNEDGKTYFHVVLSYDVVGDFPFQKNREYKEFKIDESNGDVISMKVKKI